MAADAAEIDRLISKHQDTLNELAPSIELTCNAAVALEEVKLTAEVTALENTMKSYVLLAAQLRNQIQALREVRNLTARFLEENLDVRAEYEKRLTALDKETEENKANLFRQDKFLKEFRQKVWAVNHRDEALPDDGDDILLIATQEDSLICPITKQTFVQPMKKFARCCVLRLSCGCSLFSFSLLFPGHSPRCGHVYSRAAILDYIRHKARPVGCPVAGCPETVTERGLQVDTATERELERRAARPSASHPRQTQQQDMLEL